MLTEYRLVCINPHRGTTRHYPKSSLKHAIKGLKDWNRDMARYTNNGLLPWPAHLEEREVTPWRRL